MRPTRTCVGCRQRRSSDLLVRLVCDDLGVIAEGRTLEGRGAWLCRRHSCWEQAVRAKALPRALRRPLETDGAALLAHLVGLLGGNPEETTTSH